MNLVVLLFYALAVKTQAFSATPISPLNHLRPYSHLFSSGLEQGETKDIIQKLVDEHKVLLFMKGSKVFPQCGFSNTAVQILSSFGVDFHTVGRYLSNCHRSVVGWSHQLFHVDVLADENIRSGVKEYSQWPTIPQLYVNGEFIGGSDLMMELLESGELGEMLGKSKAEKL